jgi:GR25 family glycosyltransferase involved in LPS biosynthesis
MKIYIINLDAESDRWNSSQIELSRLDLQGMRFSAVNKDQILVPAGTLVTKGVKACWESHRSVFQEFLSSGADYALIFEDDFSIRRLHRLKRLMREEEYIGFDVVQIGFLTPGIHRKIDQVYKNLEAVFFWTFSRLVKNLLKKDSTMRQRLRVQISEKTNWGFVPDDFLPGTHTYIISRKAAELALVLNNPQFLSADDFFTAWSKMRSVRFVRPLFTITTQKKFKGFDGPRFLNS